MDKETKLNTIELIRGYIGVIFLSWWALWSYIKYDVPFKNLIGFVFSMGGLF